MSTAKPRRSGCSRNLWPVSADDLGANLPQGGRGLSTRAKQSVALSEESPFFTPYPLVPKLPFGARVSCKLVPKLPFGNGCLANSVWRGLAPALDIAKSRTEFPVSTFPNRSLGTRGYLERETSGKNREKKAIPLSGNPPVSEVGNCANAAERAPRFGQEPLLRVPGPRAKPT
jgi:hypothetical protein